MSNRSMFGNDIRKSQGAGMVEDRKYGSIGVNSSNDAPISEDVKIIKTIQEQLNTIFKDRILQERNNPEFHKELKSTIEKLLNAEQSIQANIQKKVNLTQKILDEILGFGPLEPALANRDITEIMVSNIKKVYVEKKGKLELDKDIFFNDEQHLRNTIDKIVSPLGRRIDESSPIVDARLPDGSRVHAVIPPIAPDGSYLTIRKFPEYRLQPQDYLNFGSCTIEMLQFIEACVKARLNIIVSGGTGTGKTTLLNLVSNFIPDNEAILTIEDSLELKLSQDNWRYLEARPANAEGKGAVTIRDLVKAALRMRPDRIVVGEIRDGCVVDMFNAMGTGHDGSLSTIHADSPRALVDSRIPTLFGMSDMDLPFYAQKTMICSALDLIIQIKRMKDGTRKITNITHVVGLGKEGYTKLKKAQKKMDPENTLLTSEAEDEELNVSDKDFEADKIYLADIFTFKEKGLNSNGFVKGEYVSTGYAPKSIIGKMEARGIFLPPEIFMNKSTSIGA